MNHLEFKDAFNLRYNNALEGAPGLDDYEISMYLTNAQLELVKEAYSNNLGDKSSFESKEKSRRVLSELVKYEEINTTKSSRRGLVDDSVFFEITEEPMYIVAEFLRVKSNNPLHNGKLIKVIPVTHDEFMLNYNNPFRKPNYNKAWRLDISKEASKTTVEIVMNDGVQTYNVRYIKLPYPIIVADLSTDPVVGGIGLTINGYTGIGNSQLNSQVHPEIVDRAVELATLDYRESSLKPRVELNSRR